MMSCDKGRRSAPVQLIAPPGPIFGRFGHFCALVVRLPCFLKKLRFCAAVSFFLFWSAACRWFRFFLFLVARVSVVSVFSLFLFRFFAPGVAFRPHA